jgi:hypothetical protein
MIRVLRCDMMLTGHARIDARSIAMHRAVAAKLRERPEMIAVARENLTRWMSEPGRSQPYFEEWLRILARPLEEVLGLIVEDSERMTALRQCTPFAGVLLPRERWDIYDSFAVGARDSSDGGHSYFPAQNSLAAWKGNGRDLGWADERR